MMSISLDGLPGMENLVGKVMTLKVPIASAMRDIGEEWVEIIRDGMRNSGSPSEPGAFPGIVTGTLSASLQVANVSWNNVTITASAEYAEYLEEGTSKMAARPFLNRDDVAAELKPKAENEILQKVGIYLSV